MHGALPYGVIETDGRQSRHRVNFTLYVIVQSDVRTKFASLPCKIYSVIDFSDTWSVFPTVLNHNYVNVIWRKGIGVSITLKRKWLCAHQNMRILFFRTLSIGSAENIFDLKRKDLTELSWVR